MANVWQNPNTAATQDLQWTKSRTSGRRDSPARVLVSKERQGKKKMKQFQALKLQLDFHGIIQVLAYQLFVSLELSRPH